MKGLIEIYIIGDSEIIYKWILLNFFWKFIFWENKNIIFFKGNKMKGGYMDAFQSGNDRYTAKKYITTWIFPLIPLFYNVINGLF